MDENRDGPSRSTSPPDDSEALILVDADDHRLGALSKARCHEGRGVLHRAFSLFLFNGRGELLIQQRSPKKRLWPMYWSNSCCSHPRSGEAMEAATSRRLLEELGVQCPLEFLFKFEYRAQFDPTGAEHELCSVFIGCCDQPIRPNPGEIAAWRWVSPGQLDAELTTLGADRFTPWFILEWPRICRDHRGASMSFA